MTEKTEQTRPNQFEGYELRKKITYAAAVLFVASGGLAAYLHYANPAPSECVSPSYRTNEIRHGLVIRQKEAQINGMTEMMGSDGISETAELQLLHKTQEDLTVEQTLYEACQPVRENDMFKFMAIAGAMVTGAHAGIGLFENRRGRKREDANREK